MDNDYGSINGAVADSTISNSIRRRQVYQATHVGDVTLPYMKRSFISFTYGGRKIEDFDLISTISGDRLNRNGYANFEDTVTTYDNLDGQRYWSTHYKTNQLDFTLSTDGIDQKTLDDFLHWFQAGVSRELILAEHPNRAIMARVAQPPQLDLLPFGEEVDVLIAGEKYKTKTTLYKGDINLSLVMDQPYWYALVNILGKKVPGDNGGPDRYTNLWDDPFTGETDVSIFASQDALKILYEDGIPLGSMIGNNMLLGNGAFANVQDNITSLIWSIAESDPNFLINGEVNYAAGQGACINGTITSEEALNGGPPAGEYIGTIAGAIVNADGNGITSLEPNVPGYFFYAGTAPSYTQISFKLQPIMLNNKIVVPANEHNANSMSAIHYKTYNTITIESTSTQEFKFTTPNLYTSYNKVIDIFSNKINNSNTWLEVKESLRDNIRHPYVRSWAIAVIQYAEQYCEQVDEDVSGVANSGYLNDILKAMACFFMKTDNELESGSTMNDDLFAASVPYPASFTFNSETGKAIGIFTYRKITDIPTVDSQQNSWIFQGNNGWYNAGTIETDIEEDVGDMVRSNYIIIHDRNYPSAEGTILSWTQVHPEYSHQIKHDVIGGLSDLQILYRNMYL